MKKKKTVRVYFVVDREKKTLISLTDVLPSAKACYTNKKDAKKECASVYHFIGNHKCYDVYEIVAVDIDL
jgi:hypothetical protein